jgi:formate dehydrogenase subunit beta
MLAELRSVVAGELESLDGIVALRRDGQNVAPYLYRRGDALDGLALSPYFPLAQTVDLILDAHPEAHLGVVAFGCDERALRELANWNQVDLERVRILGVPCTSERAAECRCREPYPATIVVGEKASGVEDRVLQDFLTTHTREERLAYWRQQFAKCMKCYGCRDVCPLCFCSTCALEQDHWVARGRLEPPFPTFHLIKAMHTAGAGKCTQCGECERTCPAHIPLTLLYALLRRDVKELFNYEAGMNVTGKPPVFRFEAGKV